MTKASRKASNQKKKKKKKKKKKNKNTTLSLACSGIASKNCGRTFAPAPQKELLIMIIIARVCHAVDRRSNITVTLPG